MATLLPSQLKNARFRWVGYPQSPRWEAVERGAAAAERAARSGKSQAGGSAEGIEVPIW